MAHVHSKQLQIPPLTWYELSVDNLETRSDAECHMYNAVAELCGDTWQVNPDERETYERCLTKLPNNTVIINPSKVPKNLVGFIHFLNKLTDNGGTIIYP